MRKISQHSIDEVIRANDIVDVVSRYVRLEKKSALNLFGLCPFHDEKTPSFSVSPCKQMYYCFGCHKGGNVIKFVQDIEHISYPEAIRMLADRAGIAIDETDDGGAWKERRERRQQAFAALLEAGRFYHRTLESPEGAAARAYLKGRGVDRRLCRMYGIGYAPGQWDSLYQWLRGKGFSDQHLTDAGLIKLSSRNHPIDFFRGRVMFPVIDESGRILAFGGRTIADHGPKYINSPETLVYQKGKHLFGLRQAQRTKSDEVIVVEGYMDVIALARAGIHHAVAPLGTALTAYQAQRLLGIARRVLLLFDADSAGTQAALRARTLLSASDMPVRFILLEGAKDPDEYLNRFGKERLNAALGASLDTTGYKLALLKRRADAIPLFPFGERRNQALSILAEEPDGVTRELYAGRLGKAWNIPVKTIVEEVERRRTVRRDNGDKESDYGNSGRPAQYPAKKVCGTLPNTKRADGKSGQRRLSIALMAMIVADPPLVSLAPKLQETMLDGFSISSGVRSRILSSATQTPVMPEDFSPGPMRDLAASVIDSAKSGTLTHATFLSRIDELEVRDKMMSDTSENSGNAAAGPFNSDTLRRLFQRADAALEKMTLSPDEKRRLYFKQLMTLRVNRWESEAERLNEKGSELELAGGDQSSGNAFQQAAELMMAAQIMRTIIQGEQ